MSKFDQDYFFVLKERDERLPFMTPDDDTSRKPYTSELLPLHTKPLVFHNGSLEYQQQNRIPPSDPPPDLLFHGSDILVNDSLRDKLLSLEIPNLAIQPAIYIDHNNKWHEDRWYLTFLELSDYWSRIDSTYDPEPLTLGGNRYQIYSYSLDDEKLNKIPIESRRLFKMGGTTDGLLVVHVSIAAHFRLSGAVLVPIAEYGVSYP